jgi:predicted nucleic acid-binding protein
VKHIADTGLIVALLAGDDPVHAWAIEAFRSHAPFFTCDQVISEAASFFATPEPVLQLLLRGDIVPDSGFSLASELEPILRLVSKYADQPMDLADACLVRMSELTTRCRIWTVDHSDFSKYRRNGRQPVPCEFPPR